MISRSGSVSAKRRTTRWSYTLSPTRGRKALTRAVWIAIFATVQPGSGAGFELEAIGGAIIGGVSMTGGVGSITGTLAGVFVICLLKTGLPFIGLTANWQQIITGFVLIAAVLIDIFKRKKEAV